MDFDLFLFQRAIELWQAFFIKAIKPRKHVKFFLKWQVFIISCFNFGPERIQYFPPLYFRCHCRKGIRNYSQQCDQRLQWDAETCQCKCNLKCNHKQYLDPTSCSCKCKQDVYRSCMERENRYLQPDTCRCKRSNKPIGDRSTGKRGMFPCDRARAIWNMLAILKLRPVPMENLFLAFSCFTGKITQPKIRPCTFYIKCTTCYKAWQYQKRFTVTRTIKRKKMTQQ